MTWTVAVADAVSPLPSETCTRIVTRPVSAGACQRAAAPSVSPVKLPFGALQAYVSRSPSGSDALAVSRTSPPGATSHGSQDTDAVGGLFDTVMTGGVSLSRTVTATPPIVMPW